MPPYYIRLMTTVEMIGVQGIRCFSPEKMETLRFEKPLTLIVGHNGSGKTTIVECLKVATTGELPPNVDKGKNFIYDPKIINMPDVRGEIKLTFKTYNGNMVCATRIYQLLNVKDKMGKIKPSFKALESVLQVKLPSGEESCVSHKCVDMDIAVPSLVGLSKALLDSVIFCHQENNTWPLSDNATVKKRFDDLFQTSRYVKALEAIGKARKEQLEVKRDKDGYLNVCKSKLNQANEYEKQLSDSKSVIEELERKISEYEYEESKFKKRLEELRENELNFKKTRDEITRITGEINNINGRIEEVKSNLTEEYEEPLEELLQLQVEFDNQLKENEDILMQLDNEIERTKTDKSSLYDNELWVKLCKLLTSINEPIPKNLDEIITIKNKLNQEMNSIKLDVDKCTNLRDEQIDPVKNLSRNARLELYNLALEEISKSGKCVLCHSSLQDDSKLRFMQIKQLLISDSCTTASNSLPGSNSSTEFNDDKSLDEKSFNEKSSFNELDKGPIPSNVDVLLAIESVLELSNKIDLQVSARLSELSDQRARLYEKVVNDRGIKQLLMENIKLKSLQEQVRKNQDYLMTLDSGVIDCESEIVSITSRITATSLKKHELIGSLGARREMTNEIERRLEGPLYKNARANYMDARIQLQTVILAERDLAIYQKSLDLALTKYHYKKMEEINIAIKRIWQELYTGTDIDYIAVRFNEETDKSFHYRIVMCINDTELDMRGRCSAGQRMLASLVVRLALAEIFCHNCGILALDEPTTNLDVSHVKGLGESLARLVSDRKGLNGFQLIVITHDEEFASKLAHDCGCHKYYRIDKRENGSQIVPISA